MQITKLFLLLLLTATPLLCTEEVTGPLAIGNFANKLTPTPTFSIGQNIVSKGTRIIYSSVSQLSGCHEKSTFFFQEFLYGITNSLSVLLNIAVAARLQQNDTFSSGLGDIFAQFEYAYYQKSTRTYANQATVLANVTFPTGSVLMAPKTKLNSEHYSL